MKTHCLLGVLLCLLFLFPASGGAAEGKDLVEVFGNGTINWTRGIVQARGIGALSGMPGTGNDLSATAAWKAADHCLLETVFGVRIDAYTTVEDLTGDDNHILNRVKHLVRDARVVDRKTLSDGKEEVVLELNLRGVFAQTVLPTEIEQVESLKTVAPPKTSSPQPAASSPPVNPSSQEDGFTGLVVDARGIHVKPAMAPRVVDETGREVYGAAFASREFAVRIGMSGYAGELAQGRAQTRVRPKPLTVRGLRTANGANTDIVISNADASRLRSASENLSFLKRCRVVIVID
jgi:hypothetical protein